MVVGHTKWGERTDRSVLIQDLQCCLSEDDESMDCLSDSVFQDASK